MILSFINKKHKVILVNKLMDNLRIHTILSFFNPIEKCSFSGEKHAAAMDNRTKVKHLKNIFINYNY